MENDLGGQRSNCGGSRPPASSRDGDPRTRNGGRPHAALPRDHRRRKARTRDENGLHRPEVAMRLTRLIPLLLLAACSRAPDMAECRLVGTWREVMRLPKSLEAEIR